MKYATWEARNYTKKLDEHGEVYRVNIPSYICSNCGTAESKKSNFCPTCGSVMYREETVDGDMIYYYFNI